VGAQESFGAVRALFEAIGSRSPLVVVFDDIHWGEATFLDLIEHLADWMREAAVLVVCIARPELLDLRPGWSGGKLNATTVLLEPLSREESVQFLASLAGSAELADDARARIVGAADGNPLFVEEMLALALESVESGAELVVPPTIQALLAARLDRLDDRERVVLEHAAIQGEEFYDSAIAELIPEPLRPTSRDVLGSLVRKELVRAGRGGLGSRTYRFRHLLIRDAAYDSIPKQARTGLHAAFAEWLERASGERGAEHEEVVGYHYEQAYRYRKELGVRDDADRELARRAARRLGDAGRRALMRSDATAGANLISRAVDVLSPSDPLRVELIPNVRKIQGLTGDLRWADRALTEAVESAATTGDRRLAANALVQRAFLRLFTGTDTSPEELFDIAEKAIAIFEEPVDDLGLARAWRLVAQAHYLDRQAASCIEASQRALVHAQRSRDRFEEREVIEWLLIAYEFGPTPAAEGIERLQRLLATVGDDPPLQALIRSTIALFEAMGGRAEAAEEILADGRRMVEEQAELIPLMLWNFGLARLVDPETAKRGEADLREGYEALRGMGRVGHFSAFCALLAQVSYAAGNYEQSAEYVREAAANSHANDVHDQVSWRSTQAKLLAREGRWQQAEDLSREVVALAAEGDFLFSQTEAYSALGEVLRMAGRATDAMTPLEEALRLYELKGNLVAASHVRAQLKAL
jgi:tetratricopeptide (TPR) repeat protein